MPINHTGLTEQVLNFKAPHPPVKEFEPARDRAHFADPAKKSLLAAAKVRHLTPYIGTQLEGIQLSQLTDTQKDELALLAAERGVVFFRDQDLTIDQQYNLTTHYGLQDRDPNQVDPRHVTIIGREAYVQHPQCLRIEIAYVFSDGRDFAHFGAEYHSDHSFEGIPPAYPLDREE